FVDLQDVDREAPQVGQRRVAGAEVVDGQPHPERLQLFQAGDGRFDVVDQQRLGELQGQAATGQAGGRQHLGDQLRQVWLLQLPGGEVDAYRQRLVHRPATVPVRGLPAR